MKLIRIYSCLCDPTRLRILRLLAAGPLCVCHFQALLGEPQVKISKHLNYLKTRGLAASRREGNWMIYSLPEKPTRALRANLACLAQCAKRETLFQRDAQRLRRLRSTFEKNSPLCCGTPSGVKKAQVKS